MLQTSQLNHLIQLFHKKYRSVFKVLYMIDQKEADHYQRHSKSCCSSEGFSVPENKRTKVQKIVYEVSTEAFLKGRLEEILETCAERFRKVVEGGKKDGMAVTPDVEKFLIDQVLVESINHYIYTQAMKKIHQEKQSMETNMGLWATPATWYANHPNHQLSLLQPSHLSELHHRHFTIIKSHEGTLIEQLTLLQKDGKFEQMPWGHEQLTKRKVLSNPEAFYSSRDQSSPLFPSLSQTLLLFYSLPFEFNAKLNQYLTISNSAQIIHYRTGIPSQKYTFSQDQRYLVLSPVGSSLKLAIRGEEVTVKPSNIIILSCQCRELMVQAKSDYMFLFSDGLCSVSKNK